jgi:hypothetical protein
MEKLRSSFRNNLVPAAAQATENYTRLAMLSKTLAALSTAAALASAAKLAGSSSKSGQLVWSDNYAGPCTSGSAIDNAAPAVGGTSIFYMSAARDWTLCVVSLRQELQPVSSRPWQL